MAMTNMLNFEQTLTAIKNYGPYMTVVVKGENGIGKTALWRALAADPAFAEYNHVPPIDCTQLSDGSIWMPDIDHDRGISRELPNERFGVNRTNQMGIAGSKPSIVFLDEIGKARQYVKDMIAPIVYERRVGSYFMPEGSIVFAATNLETEGLGDVMQAHLRSRIVQLQMRKPTAPELIDHGTDRGWAPEVLAYIDQYPQICDSFLDYESGGKHAGKKIEQDNPKIFNPRVVQPAFANPRSLERASNIIKRSASVPADVRDAMLIGTVGDACAKEMAAFISFGMDMEKYEDIIAAPTKARVPSNATVQLMQLFMLLTRVESREEAIASCQYVDRMRNEMQSLFCRRVASSNKVETFATVLEYGTMMKNNRIFYKT